MVGDKEVALMGSGSALSWISRRYKVAGARRVHGVFWIIGTVSIPPSFENCPS